MVSQTYWYGGILIFFSDLGVTGNDVRVLCKQFTLGKNCTLDGAQDFIKEKTTLFKANKKIAQVILLSVTGKDLRGIKTFGLHPISWKSMQITTLHYTCKRLYKYCFYFVTNCNGNITAVVLLFPFKNTTDQHHWCWSGTITEPFRNALDEPAL